MAVQLLSQCELGFQRCDQCDARTDSLCGKLQACRHFFHWKLPQVDVWLRVLDPRDTSGLDMQDAWF